MQAEHEHEIPKEAAITISKWSHLERMTFFSICFLFLFHIYASTLRIRWHRMNQQFASFMTENEPDGTISSEKSFSSCRMDLCCLSLSQSRSGLIWISSGIEDNHRDVFGLQYRNSHARQTCSVPRKYLHWTFSVSLFVLTPRLVFDVSRACCMVFLSQIKL